MSSPGLPLPPVPLTPTPPPAPPSDTGADYTGTPGRLDPDDPNNDDDDMDDEDSTSAPAAAVLSNLTATSRLNRATASSLSNLSFNQKQSVLRAMFASRAGNTSMSLTKDQAQERIRQAKTPPPNPSPLKAVVSKSMPLFAGEEDEEDGGSGLRRAAPGPPPPPPPPPVLIVPAPPAPAVIEHPHPATSPPAAAAAARGTRARSPSSSPSRRRRKPHHVGAGHQSIQLHLPAPPSPTHPAAPHPAIASTLRALAPPPTANHSDKLMAQTVQSFEKCLHHAMDVSAQIMAHVTRRPALVAPTAPAAIPVPASAAWHVPAAMGVPAAWPTAPSPTGPAYAAARPDHHHHHHACACGRPVSPTAESPPMRPKSTERTSEREKRLLAQLDEIAALVQATTDRHAQITKLLADQSRDRAKSQADREMGDLVNLVRGLSV